MVTDLKNKQFHEGIIHLNADDIDALARTMHDLTDEDFEADSEASMPEASESRLDSELFECFTEKMPRRSMKRDPSCLDDKELWSRISQARASSSDARVKAIRPRNRALTIWSSALAVAAVIFLSVRFWEPERDRLDPSLNSNLKGIVIKEGLIKEKGCNLALKSDGATIQPEVTGSGVPALSSILLMAQCKSRGYLHLQLISGSDRITIPNIPVEASGDLQELMDQNQKPVGVMTPKEGFLQITYGLSTDSLKDEHLEQLDTGRYPQKHEAWLWMREVRWTILEQEARQ
ncbi:MAG TPA: hypothetical protein VE954_42005 [Oligoflexus sp.]|uniref:hypothetical protein n=1 Tax=Oligoflexus sp. TaxID=1971216 RepID=UPI002D27D0E8|nr:hypothetical protein [Oligoflexus sp.]HYX39714.1 hypothetical protein [Oligoflexus sp.]